MKSPVIKTANCIIAVFLAVVIFTVGRCSSVNPPFEYSDEEYIKKGDWVVHVQPATPPATQGDRGAWVAPNGWPAPGQRVRVLKVSDDGEGLQIEGYPTYYNNALRYKHAAYFRKVP